MDQADDGNVLTNAYEHPAGGALFRSQPAVRRNQRLP